MPLVLPASPLLRVTVEPEPWAVTLGPLTASGPPGFSADARWSGGPSRDLVEDPPEPAWELLGPARQERAGDRAYAAELAPTRPGGAPPSARLELLADGSVRVEIAVPGAAVVAQGFCARPGERFLGFGERSHAVSLAEGVIENYVGEGPYQPHEYPFLGDIVPPWGLRPRPDATYYPVPWVLSTAGYGVLVEQDDLSYFRFRTAAADRWSMEVEADRLAYRVFPGPTPLEALGRFTAATGRQPAPERWFFGPWYQSGHSNHVPLEEERRQIDALRGCPASAVETHCRYLPLGEDRGHEDAERARTAQFHAAGRAVLSYLNPLVGRDYPEAFAAAEELGALQCDPEGRPYVFQAYAGGREPPFTLEAQYDFTNPDATACWLEVAERVVEAGYDGWMEDFGEYTPLDAVASDGSTGTAGHNRYPTEYHLAAAVAARLLEQRHGRRLARFVRSGWTGTAAVAPIVWGGDPTTCWGFDGLASAVTEGLTMAASGVAMWGSDTGGFLSTLDRLTPELLRRWIQFSAFCPVMRTKAGGIEIPAYERPQIWDHDILPTWQAFARWHTALNDYLMAAHAEYRTTGRPIMCPLELAHPELGDAPDQYLLGRDLLVAPVLEEGCQRRSVLVPPGEWRHLFHPDRSYRGPDRVDVAVGSDDFPVLVRSGAVLGLLPDDVDGLSGWAAPLPDRRRVLAFPGPDWSGPLGPGLGATTANGPGTWTLQLESPREWSWAVAVWMPDRPARVTGTADWTWDGSWLRAELQGPGARLTTERV